MAITQFEQNAINQAAQHYNDMVNALQGRLDQALRRGGEYPRCEPSSATKALEATYDAWIQDVQKMVVLRVQSLSDAMTKTAQTQVDMDEQNSSNLSRISTPTAG